MGRLTLEQDPDPSTKESPVPGAKNIFQEQKKFHRLQLFFAV
jgi:hypothetical protein